MLDPKLRHERHFPSQGRVFDLAGRPFDASTSIWRLNDVSTATTINWDLVGFQSLAIFEAAVRFVRMICESQTASSAYNTWRGIRTVVRSASFNDADAADEIIPTTMFHELLAHDGDDQWQTHYVRQWYSWAANMGYPNFSPDVALEAERLRIGGNAKGVAVLSDDPEIGPLSDMEMAALLTALNAAKDGLPPHEQLALWFCVAFGANPSQMALLRESDIHVLEADGVKFFHVDVPRIKKGFALERSEFKRRALTPEIGELVLKVMAMNAAERRMWPETAAADVHPLFPRTKPRKSMVDGPMHEYAMHLSSPEFTELVSKAVEVLGVVSHRTNKPLKVTCRRLRYTFATRLVNENVSKREVAELLDHSDLQNVQVYFDIKSDIVGKLDKAMALTLGPIAQAFMGKIVPAGAAALRGNDPAAKVAVPDPTEGGIKEVGTCGSFAFCNLAAPVACYTCASFQPWMDAPHHLLLDDLLKNRERKQAAGLDARMVTLMDTTIMAIAEVIERINAMQAGEDA